MNNLTYKEVQAEFVSGHTGTTLLEIAVVVSSAPLGLCLRNLFTGSGLKYLSDSPTWLKLQIDFVCLVMPALCCFTVLSHSVGTTLTTSIVFAIILVFRRWKNYYHNFKCLNTTAELNALWKIPVTGKRPFISSFRANVNLATAVSILAVDFVIFPRRFSKAETYGSGLMDVGVGAFVISNALVSQEARGKYSQSNSLKSRLVVLLKSIQSSFPLLILGLLRLLAVKGADYQEHVSEYGVHWNFFFTLACIKVLSTLVLCIFPPSLSWFLALSIATGYQYLLDACNLKEFALHGSDGQDSRTGLLNANREGLVSCLGYLAVYFAGVQIGKYLFKPRSTFGDWVKAFCMLIVLDVIAWICLSLSQEYIEPISRRLANLSFILWMLGYNLQLIASFLLVDLIDILIGKPQIETDSKDKPVRTFCLLEAINYNGLLYFLLANVLTGAVNMTISTIYVHPRNALLILICYMHTLGVIMSVLYVKKISCKFW